MIKAEFVISAASDRPSIKSDPGELSQPSPLQNNLFKLCLVLQEWLVFERSLRCYLFLPLGQQQVVMSF